MKAALPAYYDIHGTQTPIFRQAYLTCFLFLVNDYRYKSSELLMIPNTEKSAFANLMLMMIQGSRNAYIITVLVTHIAVNLVGIW
jgi:hypothetical protein